MDVHVKRAVADGLRQRGVDVWTKRHRQSGGIPATV